jgi:hypothetical protein
MTMNFQDKVRQRKDTGRGEYTVEREVVIDGHTVAWVYYAFDHGDQGIFDGHIVMCDCDVIVADESYKGNRSSSDGGKTWYREGRDCRYRQAAFRLVQLETRDVLEALYPNKDYARQIKGNMIYALDRDVFAQMFTTLVDWALDEDRWLGRSGGGVLYYQTLAEILDTPESVMATFAHNLFKQKKIDLSGAVITRWTQADEPRDDEDEHLDDSKPPTGEQLNGTLLLHSETGTEGGYWALQEDDCEGYEGLHTLQTGDYLTVYNDLGSDIVWSGYVRLRHYNLFTEDARGMWIHADQRDVTRGYWADFFFNNLPARLTRKATT